MHALWLSQCKVHKSALKSVKCQIFWSHFLVHSLVGSIPCLDISKFLDTNINVQKVKIYWKNSKVPSLTAKNVFPSMFFSFFIWCTPLVQKNSDMQEKWKGPIFFSGSSSCIPYIWQITMSLDFYDMLVFCQHLSTCLQHFQLRYIPYMQNLWQLILKSATHFSNFNNI